MANPTTTTTISDVALKETLQDIWGLETLKDEPVTRRVFQQKTTKDGFVDDQEYAGVGVMPVKDEGATMAVDSVQRGYAKRYRMQTMALSMIVTEEALEDNKYDQILDGPKQLADAARRTENIDGANVFIRAFNSAYTGGDTLEMCSTAHLLPGGGTYSNEFSTPLSLSETAVESMIVNLKKLVSSNGYIHGYKLKKLLVPADLMFRAAKILRSEKQNDTANNAVNVLKGMGIELIDWEYLTSTSNWFGLTDAPVGLKFIWRKKPTFRQVSVEDALVKKFLASMRYDLGWSDPRGVYGSAI